MTAVFVTSNIAPLLIPVIKYIIKNKERIYGPYPAEKREYEPGVDILRVLVLVMVFILHYYFENGFYFQPVSSPAMFFHSLIRTVTVCSVPLFLILTGYLRCAQ